MDVHCTHSLLCAVVRRCADVRRCAEPARTPERGCLSPSATLEPSPAATAYVRGGPGGPGGGASVCVHVRACARAHTLARGYHSGRSSSRYASFADCATVSSGSASCTRRQHPEGAEVGCRGGWGSRHATAACTVHAHATRSSKSPLTHAGAGPRPAPGRCRALTGFVAVLCRGRSPLRAVVVQYRI